MKLVLAILAGLFVPFLISQADASIAFGPASCRAGQPVASQQQSIVVAQKKKCREERVCDSYGSCRMEKVCD